MKRLMALPVMTLLLGLLILNGCGEKADDAAKKAADKAKEAAGAAKEAATETAKSAVAWTKDKMDAYMVEMKDQLGKFDKQLEEFSAKAEKLTSEGQEKYKKNLAAATEKKDAISQKMKELQSATGDAWEKAKKELDKLMAELVQIYETIKKEFSTA